MVRRRALVPLALAVACSGPTSVRLTVPAPLGAQVAEVPDAAAPPALDPPAPGLRLPTNFAPTGYEVRLAIDPARPDFSGEVQIAGTVVERSATIWLDAHKLAFHRAVARQGAIAVELRVVHHGDELIALRPSRPLDAGAWTLDLAYGGALDEVNTAGVFKQTVDGKPYVYTQFEAIYARRAFPCLDEPDRKVPWRLTLDVPTGQVALANTAVEAEAPLDAGHTRVRFAPTRPLPSYLIAFAVGPFDVVPAGQTSGGAPIRIIGMHGRAADTAWAAKTTARLVEILEGWFGTPYPYGKLDMLAIPLTVGFGAMENPGLITFTETLILQPPTQASREREREWVTVAGHELAHQWFGDLVTMAWWDDIWLNEGFAQWMEHKVASAFDPSWADERDMLGERGYALASDALSSARQIRQPLASEADVVNIFDGITYSKGASVLAMFEASLGPALFQRGVRAYLAAHAYGSATSRDFLAAITEAAGRDVAPEFAGFLEQVGAPVVTATLTCATGAAPRLALTQARYVVPGTPASAPGELAPRWSVPVCAAYDQDGKRAEACALLDQPTGELALPAKACPRWVMPNAAGHGYYRTAFTVAEATAIRDHGWPQLTPAERLVFFEEVHEAVMRGRLPLSISLSLIPRLMAAPDRFTIAAVTTLVNQLRWLVPAAAQPRVDAWIRATFGKAARAIGLRPRPGETLDAEVSRSTLTRLAGLAGEPTLRAEAVRLAATWRDQPAPIRDVVTALAADADPATFQRLLDDARREPDRPRREDALGAVARARTPAQQRAALGLILDPALDVRETMWMLFGYGDEAGRANSEAFLREHVTELMKRLPSDDTTGGAATLGSVVTAACRAEARAGAEAFLKATFGALPGATRDIAQRLERMDQCIAQRALLEPSLTAWLATLPR
jgi:alanyl aminopeptidase